MKNILPYLSALALIAVVAASIAPLRRADGQGGVGLTTDRSAAAARGEDATAPYRADAADGTEADISLDHLPASQRLLMKAKDQLERRASIFAKLRHQVSLEGQQFFGVGSYWQQGAGEELQVYLELQAAAYEASLLQVANDRFLWVDRRLPSGRTVTRINLRTLRAEEKAWSRISAGADQNTDEPLNNASLLFSAQNGGLPGMLASLIDNFTFMPPQAMRLSVAPPQATEPIEVPVFAVVGHWKPGKLAALAEEENQERRDESQEPNQVRTTPARFPLEVLLLIGQADLFPYRVEYRRLETSLPAGDVPQEAYHLSTDPLVLLELTDVTFDAPIVAGQFDYAPPRSVTWTDQTSVLIERLRKQRQTQTARREPVSPSSATGH